jgi:hypothetical protein
LSKPSCSLITYDVVAMKLRRTSKSLTNENYLFWPLAVVYYPPFTVFEFGIDGELVAWSYLVHYGQNPTKAIILNRPRSLFLVISLFEYQMKVHRALRVRTTYAIFKHGSYPYNLNPCCN